MNKLLLIIFIFGYLIVGVFVASVTAHSTDDEFSFLVMTVWPIFLACLIIIGIVLIPFILGRWVGHFIHDLMR